MMLEASQGPYATSHLHLRSLIGTAAEVREFRKHTEGRRNLNLRRHSGDRQPKNTIRQSKRTGGNKYKLATRKDRVDGE